MENKITLSVLARMLSGRTGRSRKECEDLLRSFFQNISASLSAGEGVKVRGFGTFKISQVDARMSVDVSSGQNYEIPAHNRIVFLPAKELASVVNAPFEMFETIEIADSLTDDDLQNPDEMPLPPAESGRGEHEEDQDPESVAESESVTTIAGDLESETVAESMSDAGTAPEAGFEKGAETEPEIEPASPDNAEQGEEPEIEPASPDNAEQGEKPEIEPASPDNAGQGEEPESGLIHNTEYTLDDQDNDEPADMIPQNEESVSVSRRMRSRFRHGFIWGAVVAVVVIALGLSAMYIYDVDFQSGVDAIFGRNSSKIGKVVANAGTKPVDSAIISESRMSVSDEDESQPDGPEVRQGDVVPTKPSDQVIYDTVTPTAGLGSMARKHYGNYHFWPYIYKENEKILGHPDRIKAGTRVVVPMLSKYGVDKNNKKDIEKAKNMGAEIYSRYKKSGK